MKNKSKKILSLMLVMLVLFSGIAGCSKKDPVKETVDSFMKHAKEFEPEEMAKFMTKEAGEEFIGDMGIEDLDDMLEMDNGISQETIDTFLRMFSDFTGKMSYEIKEIEYFKDKTEADVTLNIKHLNNEKLAEPFAKALFEWFGESIKAAFKSFGQDIDEDEIAINLEELLVEKIEKTLNDFKKDNKEEFMETEAVLYLEKDGDKWLVDGFDEGFTTAMMSNLDLENVNDDIFEDLLDDMFDFDIDFDIDFDWEDDGDE